MKPANIQWKQALLIFMALLLICPFTAAAQTPTAAPKPAATASKPASGQLPKIWHREASKKDFRVEIKGDVLRADWVNIPAAAAKDGTYMRIECRRAGTNWVGTASVYQGFAVPEAPAGKDTAKTGALAGKETTKMCHLTSRFEVDSITPEKITFHSEVLRNFDASKCQVLKTSWEEFAWVPKK
ncbi:MAG: hypothetical protein WAO35_18980 [Terriglobia bacterium]